MSGNESAKGAGQPAHGQDPLPLPSGNPPHGHTIKWLHLIRHRIAMSYEWHVQFVISSADPTAFKKPCADSGMVGVDVGYRMRPKGLRVAYYVGEDGDEGELLLPHRWLAGMRKTEDLASIRDKAFNTALLVMKNRMTALENPPAWLIEQTATLPSWKSPARLAGLLLHWAKNRFGEAGSKEDELFHELEAWRK